MSDPTDTITTTTSDADVSQWLLLASDLDSLRTENERLRKLEDSHCETFRLGVYHQDRADKAEREVVEFRRKLRSADAKAQDADERLARAEAIEAAARQVYDAHVAERQRVYCSSIETDRAILILGQSLGEPPPNCVSRTRHDLARSLCAPIS